MRPKRGKRGGIGVWDTDRRAVLSFSTVNRSLCEICSLGNLLVCVKLNSLYFCVFDWGLGGWKLGSL